MLSEQISNHKASRKRRKYIYDNNFRMNIYSIVSLQPQLGVCQVYTGSTCDIYLKNQTVFIPPNITIDILEERLKAAYGVIKESKDMNPNCRVYALPSLCYSILPICRTPEKTNHQYFANKANAEYIAKKSKPKANLEKKSLRKIPTTTSTTTSSTTEQYEFETEQHPTTIGYNIQSEAFTMNVEHFLTESSINDNIFHRQRRSFDVTVDARTKFVKNRHFVEIEPEKAAFRQTEYPPTRSSENLRRICRYDCELLENELCQKEYAIAKLVLKYPPKMIVFNRKEIYLGDIQQLVRSFH